MLRENDQVRISLSPYSGIYDAVVPQDHLLRKIKDSIDFSFVNPMLKRQYCETFGRPAKEPEMMFKLMFMKKIYDLSDVRLISQAGTDMAMKYFLDLDPEAPMIDPSLMTKFRKTRITEDILEDMLGETVRQAVEKGLIKSTAIIVDATHSKSSAKYETPTQVLRRLTKDLRREIYRTQIELSGKFPDKPEETADLNLELEYSKLLIERVRSDIESTGTDKMRKLLKKVIEMLESDKIMEIQSAVDEDARLGHKSESNPFFGYKTHIAMTEERIITGLAVTTGEAEDGGQLRGLIEQSQKNGVTVNEVIGDAAYSGKDNLDYARDNGIAVVSKLRPCVSDGRRKAGDGFVFNKDADTYRCPAGHLAVRKTRNRREGKNSNRITYFFDVEKCKQCPRRGTCYKESKNKTYTITLLKEAQAEQKVFQDSDYFKSRARERYMIEAKNSELKQFHGLETADSSGVTAMRLQSYFTAFAVNAKRMANLQAALAP